MFIILINSGCMNLISSWIEFELRHCRVLTWRFHLKLGTFYSAVGYRPNYSVNSAPEFRTKAAALAVLRALLPTLTLAIKFVNFKNATILLIDSFSRQIYWRSHKIIEIGYQRIHLICYGCHRNSKLDKLKKQVISFVLWFLAYYFRVLIYFAEQWVFWRLDS